METFTPGAVENMVSVRHVQKSTKEDCCIGFKVTCFINIRDVLLDR